MARVAVVGSARSLATLFLPRAKHALPERAPLERRGSEHSTCEGRCLEPSIQLFAIDRHVSSITPGNGRARTPVEDGVDRLPAMRAVRRDTSPRAQTSGAARSWHEPNAFTPYGLEMLCVTYVPRTLADGLVEIEARSGER